MNPDLTNPDSMNPTWRDGYHNGYIQGVGIVIAFLDHVAGIAPERDADWTKQLADSLRKAAANIPSRPRATND